MQLTPQLSGRTNGVESAGGPLVLAIHGGTYTSAYFDVPGHSLLARGAANGVRVVAVDRPGYLRSPSLPAGQMDIAGQAAFLTDALGDVWAAHGAGCAGVVLIGHSIGAAIATAVAASSPRWPLLGLALSGVGLTTNPGDHERWQALPDIPLVEMPPAIKNQVMFGPEGTFAPETPALTDAANASAPKAELLAITGDWHDLAPDLLGRIDVPVHYRQGEHDRLWIVNDDEVAGFAAALTKAPLVDARLLRGAGHCIDFHHAGPAFRLQQIGFALECALG